MTQLWHDVELDGVIDLHVHTAPDEFRSRWYTAVELAREAAAARMAGVVVKSHHESTVARAQEACRSYPQIQTFGGITLNEAIGGVRSESVQQSLSDGGRVVWLPTLDGCGERLGTGREGGLALTNRGDVIPELRRIFELIAEANVILATGHTSAEEILPVVCSARRSGVNNILVNHPEIPFLSFSVELQMRLRDEGAFLERCYPRPEMENGFDQIADEMRQVGVESTILATDLGRQDMLNPLDGMRHLIYEMRERGFDEDEISIATKQNAKNLLSFANG